MKLIVKYSAILAILIVAMSCKRKLEKNPDLAPETIISPESINLTGDNRLNSVVFLSWYGTDVDGYVAGYEISLDNVNWVYTTQNDSLFSFTLAAGSDTTDIDFYVRAIDDSKLTDPTPAYLKVPLKNTAPVATFVENGFPADTTNIVTTFRWNATDVDGDETIIKAFLKANQGDWMEIDVQEEVLSIVPISSTQTGLTEANVYYGTNATPLTETLKGLVVGDTNHFYVKVIDFANSESEPDTSNVVFVKPQISSRLYISGLPKTATNVYKNVMNSQSIDYDALDYYTDGGKYQPGFWAPTFDLMVAYYDEIVLTSDESTFTNSVTGRKSNLLNFMAPSLQTFSNNGGKSLISTSFIKGQDISGITGVVPIDSLSSSGGQARLYPDSALVSNLGPNYPDLSAQFVLSGMTPFYMSIGAEEVYLGELTPLQGWSGPNVMGCRRKNGSNNYYQYFFSIQLHTLDQVPSNLETLFNQILTNDFNW
tara:strand:- start:10427 stop:11872 length:1446 start_codon:yes stop_codon:yes gene_type:complete